MGPELSTDEAIAYTQRGRERNATTEFRGGLRRTPAERDVVQSWSARGCRTRTVRHPAVHLTAHGGDLTLTHVYTKLGLSPRVQLAQEAARHA